MSVPQKPGKKGGVKRTKTTALATSTTPHPIVSSQTAVFDPHHPTLTSSPLTAAQTMVSMTTTTVLPGSTVSITPTVQPIIKVGVL